MDDLYRRLPATGFAPRGGELHAERVALSRIAEAVGTPFYCYSAARLRERYWALADAVGPLGVSIHFAMKANSNQAVLALFGAEGAGADIVSGGEMARALAAGIPPRRIVFSGVGKTASEIAAALDAGLHQINVESIEELRVVEAVAAQKGLVADVALRINPDVDAETHAKITTGKKDNKFGVDIEHFGHIDNEAKSFRHVRIVGLAVHIGSQIMSGGPFRLAYERLLGFADRLKAKGYPLTRLDLGGGFGIPYENELEFGFGELADTIRQTVHGKDYDLAIEPGRSLVADAGILVSRVVHVKDTGDMRFLILDAAMNDLVRPAMYEAHHDIVPVRVPEPGAETVEYDIVGPICESSDTFARRRDLPAIGAGDLVAVATAGAYGATMSSTYNARPLIPEVLVDHDRFAIVRRRVTVAEQIGWDSLPDWLDTASARPSGVRAAE